MKDAAANKARRLREQGRQGNRPRGGEGEGGDSEESVEDDGGLLSDDASNLEYDRGFDEEMVHKVRGGEGRGGEGGVGAASFGKEMVHKVREGRGALRSFSKETVHKVHARERREGFPTSQGIALSHTQLRTSLSLLSLVAARPPPPSDA